MSTPVIDRSTVYDAVYGALTAENTTGETPSTRELVGAVTDGVIAALSARTEGQMREDIAVRILARRDVSAPLTSPTTGILVARAAFNEAAAVARGQV